MKTISVRSLHRNTNRIVNEVEAGERFVVQKCGVAVAELCPLNRTPGTQKLPDREQWIAQLPRTTDSGRVLEQDR